MTRKRIAGAGRIGERFGDKAMLRNTMISVVVGILCVAILGGCSKKQEAAPAAQAQEQAKTAAEYKAEADKEITEQNVNQELDKIEQEVEAEATADANQT
ncbi:MAG: hypothetical protein ABFE13_27035 [Phycisphaerales bacterium]